MQPKFTLKKLASFFLKGTPVLIVFFCLFGGKINAQQYVNGVLSTGATSVSGVAAPAGTTWSECQNPTGNTTIANTNAGYAAQISANNAVADDFIVPAGPSWAISKITVYAYSTGAAAGSSPFNDLRLQIHNSSPLAGPTTIVFGNLTTNRLSTASNSNVFRIFNTVVTPATAPGTTRIIWKLEANVSVTLAPGTYWLEYQTGTALTSNFTPASSPVGVRTLAGYNAIQRIATTWSALVDAGQGPASPANVAVDFPFTIDYTTGPCAGTPTPGNTLANAATVCSSVNFNLSLQNTTPGSGVTYKWQRASAIGGPYTDIPGATNSTLTTSLTATTFYQAVVTCGVNSGTSTPVQVLLTPAASCYCVPAATDCSLDDEILNVTVGSFTNSSSGCSGAGYTNYTALPGLTLFSGAPNPVSVSVGPGGTETVYVWIDYDKNGAFDPSEFSTLGVGNGSTINGSVTVPAGVTGPTRMRVRVRFGATLLTGSGACIGGFFGETEDYTVNFAPCVQGVFTSQPISATTNCSGNANFSVAATGTFLNYFWQYRISATSPWLTVPNAGIYSGVNSPSLLLINVPQSISGYQYRAVMQGACTSVDFSTPATLTVTPLVATVSPVSASVCLGSAQKITLTNPTSTPVYGGASGLPLAIPDGNTAGVASTINVFNVPAGATITDVSVKFSMPHTWVGDVVMNLRAPNGQVLNLIGALDNGGGGNSSDDFINTVISSTGTIPISGAVAPRTGTFRADAFNATVPTSAPTTTTTWPPLLTTLNGAWSLVTCDLFTPDAGTLTSWSLTITYIAPPATGVWTSNPATPNTMFTDAAATVPYVAGAQANAIWVKPTVNTSYSVVYSTSAPSSCTSAPATVPVTIVTPVSAPTITPATLTACVGGSASFVAAATGGPATYQWEVSTNGGVSFAPITGQTSATLTISGLTATMNNNRYRAVISAGPCTGSVTTPAAILTVNPIPVITIAAPATQLIPGRTTTITATSTTSGLVYTYTRNNVATGVTGATQFVNIDSLGSYRATGTLTGASGCTGTSNALVIGSEASDRLFIYPNPTDGVFQVRLFYPADVNVRRQVSVFNMNGQMVATKNYDFVRGLLPPYTPYAKVEFDLRHVAPGTYIVKVTEKNTTQIVSGLIVIQ